VSGSAIIERIEIIPIRLPLIEPFAVSYATYDHTCSVLVRITAAGGAAGWGESVPDQHVTGETWGGVTEALRHELGPALLGLDARNIEAAHRAMDARISGAPAARAALDIALHDLHARIAGCPIWALLGGRTHPRLTISRVVSMADPDRMAAAAARHVDDGFRTVKIKVGDAEKPLADAARIAAVRAAIGPATGLKIDVNQGWQNAGTAISAIRASLHARPDYYEQPVAAWDLDGLAEVRRQSGATIMADEGVLGPREMLRAVRLRAADLVNIKLMKTGGLHPALAVNAIAEAAGIPAQVGTMVESAIASAAGLHLATALANVRTVEMGGPLMHRADVAPIRSWYERDTIAVPDAPGLGIAIDEASILDLQTARYTLG
jgi:L-alanine-DL-glutamate epimerase-like enolase superfamily enzyme